MNFGPCPKCGLMQILRDKCRSCGKPLGYPAGPAPVKSAPPPTEPERPVAAVASPAPVSPVQQAEPQRPAAAVEEPARKSSPVTPSPYPPPLTAEEAVIPVEVPAAKAGPAQTRRLCFKGTGGELFGIQLVNLLLTIVTLGFYSFWAKTKVRNYLWSQTELEGERFVYHGTARELMAGSFKVGLLVIVPLVALDFIGKFMGANLVVKVAVTFLAYAMVLVLTPMALAGARRYRLTRTSWRGIRFSFRGVMKEFVVLFLSGGFLTAITLGLYYPFFDARRQAFMVNNAFFGNRAFLFDGQGRDLFKPFLVAMLLFIPTLGLSWVWYAAARQRYFWDHTRLDDVRFRCTVTFGQLLVLYLTNFLLLAVTLGLAWSWVMVRNIRFTFTYLSLEGGMDLSMVRQEAQTATATGDALAGFMDAGLDVGY